MFTFELTDNYILIYNHKTKEIIKEEIPYNIISNNKIYDYLKLNIIIIDIINKYKLLNSSRLYTLISTSTPQGNSSFIKESTVFAVEL